MPTRRIVALVVLALGLTVPAGSQQPGATRRIPQLENDAVRVWKSIIAPGQPLTMHRHEAGRVIVALAGGTLKIVKASGESRSVVWETGKAYWLPADPPGQTHGDTNEGPSPIEVMVVELMSGAGAYAQTEVPPNNTLPNPYQTIEHWAKMPEGRTWGSTSAVEIDRDGVSLWVAERCGANTCAGSDLPAILKFDASGKLVTSFGAGMFIFPHGIHVDRDGNVWVTDGVPPGGVNPQGTAGKGHQVVKFSPEGKVLLKLGKAGVAGEGPDTFNQPSDVAVAPNGDVFVADGHGGDSNARIVKFTRDGKFVKAWGRKGSAPGEFDTPHGLAFDSQGRLFVADRNNNRIQIFDQEGKFLDQWKQFSRLSGIYIDRNDVLYGADSESNTRRNPGWKRGIRIGNAKDGKVSAFIPDPEPEPDKAATSGAEGVAADVKGNVYGAEVGPRSLKKYVKR